MEQNYALDPVATSYGRTLWNNLVVGNKTGTLDFENRDFERLSTPEEVGSRGVCSFSYKGISKVHVTSPNQVRIESDDDEDMRVTGDVLKGICDKKGCPLVDIN